ncbi:VOC family protein [Verticiella sediminum]|uniref:VOC family protein n=1 Tax=Verticiella sediminum TaxID=1247510 RepID=A0A556A5V3_9BURK|nr:VOC family protein [Verticiella sediminum]TSH88276.1 VOC family protein [Verticiella sediminum]
MAQVIQHLWFARDMRAALDFYTRVVPRSRIDWTSTLPIETPSGPPGSVHLAGFRLGDQRYQAIEAGPLDPFNHSFSVMLECDDQAELDRIWAAFMAEGAQPEQCGWLRDRWGLAWQIAPRRLGELMSDPDVEVQKRVGLAFMGMVKFDIAALEAAARG